MMTTIFVIGSGIMTLANLIAFSCFKKDRLGSGIWMLFWLIVFEASLILDKLT